MTISPVAARMAAPAPGTSADVPPDDGFTMLLGRHLGAVEMGALHGAVSGFPAEAPGPLVAALAGLVSASTAGAAGGTGSDPVGTAGPADDSTADAGPDEDPAEPALGTEVLAATCLGRPVADVLGNAPSAGPHTAAGGAVGISSSDLGAATPSGAVASAEPGEERPFATRGEATSPAARQGEHTEVLAGPSSAAEATDSAQKGRHEAGAAASGVPAHAAGDKTHGSAAAPVDVLAGTIHGAESRNAVTVSGGQATTNAGRTNPVTDQVLAQVTRLVSRGDGTHRLTLRLHPADLGEVKVVLTVRDSTVDITLAAGARAREALHEGSPQLRALLEMTGATTGHVIIRDLSTGAVTLASSTGGHQHNSGNGTDQTVRQGTTEHPGSAGAGLGGHAGDGTGNGPFDHADGAHGAAPGPGDVASETARSPGGAGTDRTLRPGGPSPSRLDLNL